MRAGASPGASHGVALPLPGPHPGGWRCESTRPRPQRGGRQGGVSLGARGTKPRGLRHMSARVWSRSLESVEGTRRPSCDLRVRGQWAAFSLRPVELVSRVVIVKTPRAAFCTDTLPSPCAARSSEENSRPGRGSSAARPSRLSGGAFALTRSPWTGPVRNRGQ